MRARGPRLAPLAAALALAGAVAVDGDVAASTIQPFSVATPASWKAGDGSGVAAFMQALRAVRAKRPPVASGMATVRPVSSCADDSSGSTLRDVVAAAGTGDTVDLSQLSCSAITLSQGAIPVMVDDLAISGTKANALAIDGAGLDRVFIHYGYGTLTLNGLTVRNGVNSLQGYKVAAGACIVSNGYVTLNQTTVSGCVAAGEGAYGGGIIARGVTLYTSTLSGNIARGTLLKTLTAAYGGGAFAYRGTAALYDSTVSGNRVERDPANNYSSYDTGGGIFTDAGGIAYRSTIDGNFSTGTGGGIASHDAFFVSNSTISGNTAKEKAGGGIFVSVYSAMSIGNSTIANNAAVKGGGIYVAGAPQAFTLQSTIVAGNSASIGAADIAAHMALVISGANNLVVVADADVTTPVGTLHTAPHLLPLANNGGPTRTHALTIGSPAIDAGNNSSNVTTDQRGSGFPRVLGVAADIGAYEGAQAAPLLQAVPAASAWLLAVLASLTGWLGLRTARSWRK